MAMTQKLMYIVNVFLTQKYVILSHVLLLEIFQKVNHIIITPITLHFLHLLYFRGSIQTHTYRLIASGLVHSSRKLPSQLNIIV